MKTPGWFKRGAATAAVYFVVVLVVAGALTALLALSARPLMPEETRTSLVVAIGGGFAVGAMTHAPSGLICGLSLALLSAKIRRKRVWLGSAIVGGLVLSVLTGLLMFRLFRTSDVAPMVAAISLTAFSIPAVLANLSAAFATLRLRPSPLARPTADVFA